MVFYLKNIQEEKISKKTKINNMPISYSKGLTFVAGKMGSLILKAYHCNKWFTAVKYCASFTQRPPPQNIPIASFVLWELPPLKRTTKTMNLSSMSTSVYKWCPVKKGFRPNPKYFENLSNPLKDSQKPLAHTHN